MFFLINLFLECKITFSKQFDEDNTP